MTRNQALSLAPVIAFLATFGWRAQDGARPELSLRGGAAAARPGAARPAGAADPRVDSARVEAAAGRPWHASILLRAATASGLALARDDALLLARSDLAWRNWAGVVEQLEGKPWLAQTGGGEAWLLLGRAREEQGEWPAAADAYTRYFDTQHAKANPLAAGERARQARALANAGRAADARAALDAATVPVVVSWATLDAASPAADSGRAAEVRALLPLVTDSVARAQGWELIPRALLAGGDSAGAEAAYREATGSAVGAVRRARAWSIVGDLARARKDDVGARAAYQSALAAGLSAAGAARAAKALLAMGGLDAEQALLVAQALDRANDDAAALQAYDLHARLRGGAAQVAEEVRLNRARILTVTAGRENDAAAEFRALSTSARDRVGAPALELWARLREKQGRARDVDSLRAWLIERYPSSAEAADVVFFKGDAPHDRNDLDAALREYRRVMAMAPDQDRAGLATMRVGQILVLRKDLAGAAQIYEGYLAAFPQGRRWQESSYWAARARLSLGDTTKARVLVERLRKEDPFSYYTMIASDLLGEPYRLDLPPGEAVEQPDWLKQGLLRVDQLRAGGLDGGASAEVERLTAQAKAAGAGAVLALAEALSERDRTIDAINLGFELRRQGSPWTIRLAKVIYPWRYQDVFRREAAEDGVDPYLIAALARQESAFDPDIHSSANAVGLMQLLPSTAAALARSVGPQGFREELLEIPDVNVHLGTLHLRDLLKENQGDITRFLAGYNAGQHRVTRWKNFAEAGEPLTFTERIPFAETRDYVKQVQRNVAVYKLLYGNGSPPPAL